MSGQSSSNWVRPENMLPTPKSQNESPSPKGTADKTIPTSSEQPNAAAPTSSTLILLATSKDTTDPTKIATQLEQSISNDMAAVNARDWSPSSALFHRKAPDWEAELPGAISVKKLSCEGFVTAIKSLCEMYPDYQVHAVDFNTAVDVDKGTAEIFCNVETSGVYDGVAQRNVTLCEYRCIDGFWHHTAHRTMPGMDPMNAGYGTGKGGF